MPRRMQYVLIAALAVLTLVASACGAGPAPTATPVPPTKTPVPPTPVPATAVPPTAKPQGNMDPEQRIAEGGFAFQPPKDYEAMPFGSMVYLIAPGGDETNGPMILLAGGAGAEELVGEATSAEELMGALTEQMADPAVTLSDPKAITVGGVPAQSVDFNGTEDGVELAGQLVAAMPAEKQVFILMAMATAEKWEGGFSNDVAAVLGTVKFFAPTVPSVEPIPTAAPVPTAAGGSLTEITQYASGATASSEYGSSNWSAMRATGKPDVIGCGDDGYAWASSDSDTVEWIELTYDIPVVPTLIRIIQTYNPNQVVKVEGKDLAGQYHTLYTGEVEPTEDCPYTLEIVIDGEDYPINALRITIDQTQVASWNEIDAVKLVGLGDAGAVPPTAGPTAAPTAVVQPTPLGGQPPAGFAWRISRQPGDLFYAGAGLAIGQDGNIYFVDSLARFHVVSPGGEILNTVQDYDYMFVTADIDIGPDGNLYIADWGSDEYPIIVYTPEGEYVRSWGSKGTGDGQFGDYSPSYLAICNEEVFVVDGNETTTGDDIERVQVFDLEGTYLRQWSITEYEDFFSAKGIACGPDGNLYLVGFMSSQILSFSPEGEFLGQVGDDALDGTTPSSLAMDADGFFYVGTWDEGVLKVDPDGNVVATWGSNTDEDGPRAEGVFAYADAITVDGEGNVYVVDWNSDNSYMTKFVFP